MSNLARVLLVITASTGCLSNPARGTKASGEPLRVRFDTTTGSYRAQEVVGQDTYYDADGNAAGSVERTRAVTKRWSNTDVSFFQGDERLDEQDYYLIAGNRGAADEVAVARAQMSRDLTIGVPLAVVGSLASTLFAIGTFGDSPALRYGGSTAASVAALAGALFVLRGMKTKNKKSMVEPERAIQHAAEVERCYRDRCRKEPGGAPRIVVTAPPPPTLTMRKPPSTPLVGKWSGKSRTVLGRGQAPRTTSMQIAIEAGTPGMVIVVLEPSDPQSCRLEARLAAQRAELIPGQSCTHKTERNEITIEVRDGSSIQLDGEELTMTLEANFVMRDRSRRPHRVARTVASMSGIATRM